MRLKEYKIKSFIWAFFIILGLWQLVAILINKPLFPPPYEIVINIFQTFNSEIAIHALYSLKRIIIGIGLTLVVAIPLGILMGYFNKVDSLFSPILYFNYPVPKMALLPIIMLIFGLGDLAKIFMIFLITVFQVIVNIRDEVKNIPEEVFYPLNSLGASNLQIIKEIILPGILPTILTALRLGIGTAISVLFFTENYGTEFGMGYYIMDSWMRVNYIQMYSGILVLSIMGLLFFVIIDIIENIACPWK